MPDPAVRRFGMRATLWVRADGSPRIGLGHLSRTSALAEAGAEAGMAIRYVTSADDLARAFLERRGLACEWLGSPTDVSWLAGVQSDDVIVFDRYDIEPFEVEAARATGAPVAVLDDHGAPTLPADLVLNPNDDVDASHLPASTVVLQGPTYALVRAAFRTRRRVRFGSRGRLIVTMGGSDPGGHGATVVGALGDTPPFEEVVLVEGPGAPTIHHRPPWLVVVRDPQEIADVFDTADAAITAGGASCWELLAMGVPTAVVAVSDNQRGVASGAVGAGAAIPITASLAAEDVALAAARLSTAPTQRELSEAALRAVDGLGPARVVEALRRTGPRRTGPGEPGNR